ncbi:MAG TPA: SDR family NAD(P)-dependent oxidoreductase, partial [Ottowia sp.]|nr:SDR family NAD(P)-dependent oxidoreductase [Ottowia sp.]
MPSNQNPLGALPARFRRPRVLIVGFGDVGVRAARLLTPRVRVLALVREAARAGTLRAQGVTPLLGDLDDAASLRRLAGI